MRCYQDKRTPKLYSAINKMNPVYNLRKSIQCMVNSDHFYSMPLFEEDKLLCELRLAPKMSCIRLVLDERLCVTTQYKQTRA